jgi:hypothetical protein
MAVLMTKRAGARGFAPHCVIVSLCEASFFFVAFAALWFNFLPDTVK